MIIAVTGTPGTGKSEVAKLLAKELDWKFVNLNVLAEKNDLYEGYDKERKCKIVDMNRLAEEVEIMGKLKDIVLDGHFSHDLPCDVVIILRCNPRELRKRMEKRNWFEEKIEENIEAEIMDVIKEEALEKSKKIIEIDTTGKTVQETVKIAKIKLKRE
ncbi:MAG: adenylate kinase family protein [Nanoarchaeota archaeon]